MHKKIDTEDWESVFSRYSQNRLQDTINEHRYELPDIERLLLGMKPNHDGYIDRKYFDMLLCSNHHGGFAIPRRVVIRQIRKLKK